MESKTKTASLHRWSISIERQHKVRSLGLTDCVFGLKKCCIYQSCCRFRYNIESWQKERSKNKKTAFTKRKLRWNALCLLESIPMISPFLTIFVNLRRQLLPNLLSCCCIPRHPLDIVDPTIFRHCSIINFSLFNAVIFSIYLQFHYPSMHWLK